MRSESQPELRPESSENKVLRLLLSECSIECTLPGRPNSRLQNYRLTEQGMALLAELKKGRIT